MVRSGSQPSARSNRALTPLPLAAGLWAQVVQSLQLSPQQARIVELILRGCQDKDIAAALGAAVPTVRTHLGRVFLRVGATDRVTLVLRVFAVAESLRDSHRS